MAATVEQVRKELNNTVERLKAIRVDLANVKSDQAAAKASGDKATIQDAAKERDRIDNALHGLKEDRLALSVLINSTPELKLELEKELLASWEA